jgi:late competence protein required for DNA uptake (superfamily II DNA/RNA helicase)
MKIKCNKCGQLLADVTNGSKVRKGLIVYCQSCFLVEGSSNIDDIFNLWK